MTDLYAQLRQTLQIPDDHDLYVVATDEGTANANEWVFIASSYDDAEQKFYAEYEPYPFLKEDWQHAVIYRLKPLPHRPYVFDWHRWPTKLLVNPLTTAPDDE